MGPRPDDTTVSARQCTVLVGPTIHRFLHFRDISPCIPSPREHLCASASIYTGLAHHGPEETNHSHHLDIFSFSASVCLLLAVSSNENLISLTPLAPLNQVLVTTPSFNQAIGCGPGRFTDIPNFPDTISPIRTSYAPKQLLGSA